MGQCKGERGGATDDLSGSIILRTVARADELLLGLVPWYDAPQVCAYGVQGIALDGLVLLDDEV